MSNDSELTPTPKRIRRSQDQQIADGITTAYQIITMAQNDIEIFALVSVRGYDTDKLGEGLTLYQLAQTAFGDRQQAIGIQKQATAALISAEAAARRAYSDFRETARAIFKDSATRNALGLLGSISKDLQKFATTARAGYETALNVPTYQSLLAQYGYSVAVIQAARDLLDAFLVADGAQAQAIGAAQRATQQRDVAVEALNAWVRQFRAIAKVATRNRRDLAQKLGL